MADGNEGAAGDARRVTVPREYVEVVRVWMDARSGVREAGENVDPNTFKEVRDVRLLTATYHEASGVGVMIVMDPKKHDELIKEKLQLKDMALLFITADAVFQKAMTNLVGGRKKPRKGDSDEHTDAEPTGEH